ncbi:MAG: heavy metal translocating P-type ATPase [Desulfurococcaceae archaeon]
MVLVKERIRVVGLDCPTCVYSIQRNLRRLEGFHSIEVDLSSGDAIIEYDLEKCSLRSIYRAVRDAGYDLLKERVLLALYELDESEVGVVESRISSIAGVIECRASPITKLVSITYNPLSISSNEVVSRVKSLGIRAIGFPQEILGKERGEEFPLLRRLAAFSIGLFVVLYATIGMYYELLPHYESELLLASLATVAVVMGFDVILKGLRALAKLSPTMDSLIALSASTTLITGIASVLGFIEWREGLHSTSFFEASAGVIGFVGLGKYLEERLRRRALGSLEDLAKTFYGKARVVGDNGVWEKDISSILPGEIVEVKAGEIIPVDGVVIEGWGYVDESSFTGESMPRLKKADNRDPVLAGSILTSGYLKIRVTRATRDTVLHYIIETVREAQFYKPKIMRIADRVVGLLTWAVIAIAVFTLVYWWLLKHELALALMFSAAVLAIACPCALGISIPMAVSIAVLRAAKSGLLIRRGDVFERAIEVSTVLFDKTGTLTLGKPSIIRLHLTEKSIDERQVLSYACSVESRSEHPISKAIVNYCVENSVETEDLSDFIHMPGMGVVGFINNIRVAVGNLELMNRLDISYNDEIIELVEEIGSNGFTAVLIAVGDRITGVLEIGDVLKPEAENVIKELKMRGLKIGIVSGDTDVSVSYYSKILDLDLAFSELKPSEKAELIKDMQSRGERVMFVGDGVNDALAISSSFLGVAVGSGSEISRESGDLVLARSNLEDLVFFFKLSRAVRRKSVENLAWAFIYNAILIPVAAGLLYVSHGIIIKPEAAALAMLFSDVSVILNAMTLLAKKI